MKILSVAQMNQVDRLTSEICGLPTLILMENAGVQLYQALQSQLEEGSPRIAILCGKGNNGGDGIVLARQLRQRGFASDLFLLAPAAAIEGDAGINLQAHLKARQPVVELTSEESVQALDLACYDIIVDALLGTGLSQPLSGRYLEVVRRINSSGAFVLAVDIPTGMDSDLKQVGGDCVRADLTVTFTTPKIAHVLHPDPDSLGAVRVVPIGSPDLLLDRPQYFLNLMTAKETRRLIPPRPAKSHKGSYGRVAVLAGSRGKSGAALLASRAALTAGAGLVTVLLPEVIAEKVTGYCPELMTESLACDPAGALAEGSLPQILECLEGKDVLAVGPGLSRQPGAVTIVKTLLPQSPLPLVVDADGINALSTQIQLLDQVDQPLILTPHPGEFARLTGLSSQAICESPITTARAFARQHQVWLILKGFRTLLAQPNGEVWVCPLGNPGMATAGMGDVLTGVVATLWGAAAVREKTSRQDWSEAARVAIYVHSLAGDLAWVEVGPEALTAGSVIEHLGPAFQQLRQLGD